MNLKDFWDFWQGKSPPVRVNTARDDDLHEASATLGTLIIGNPGTGKTRYAAMQIYKRWKANPHPVFVFDWSGGITNCLLELLAKDKDYEKLRDKVILDELGNEYVIKGKPELHPEYGLTEEEQVSRIVDNMENLASFMTETAKFIGAISIQEIGKNLLKLLHVIRLKPDGESWQITEGLNLITDQSMLRRACQKFGQYAITAKRYFEKQYLPKDEMPPHEKHLLTTVLRAVLGKIDGDVARAILGYHTPGWTPKEADEEDLLVIIDAHKMINTPAAQHYLLTQNFSLVMYWINKREVDNPNNKLAEIVFDETVSILKIPGFAEKLGSVSPLYRSRRVSLTVIIQALWQLDEELAKQIWNLANIVSFTLSNVDDAETIARQLFKYDPKMVKLPAKTEYQNPTTEGVTGGDRIAADWLQNLKARQFIMRRYLTEQKKEDGVQYVEKTDDMPTNPPYIELYELKRYLLVEQRKPNGMPRCITIREALEAIRDRENWLDVDKSDPTF